MGVIIVTWIHFYDYSHFYIDIWIYSLYIYISYILCVLRSKTELSKSAATAKNRSSKSEA
jgi:ABC-type transport system involved in Fe-S cluster assembly fused permease/ATPase subunit